LRSRKRLERKKKMKTPVDSPDRGRAGVPKENPHQIADRGGKPYVTD